MTQSKIVALRSLELGVTNLADSGKFYGDAWGLVPVLQTGDLQLFRATGLEHHVLCLRAVKRAGLLKVNFAAQDAEAVDLLYEQARAVGQRVLTPPHEREASCGGGYGLDILSPEGLPVGVSAAALQHSESVTDKTRPTKLTHVVVNSADASAQVSWFVDFLGFRVSDSTRTQEFLRCGPDHHSIAFARGGGLSLNHAAFEMADIDGLMYGAGRMLDHGFGIEWGLGRHGPGSNVFNYFIDPEGFAVEYTTEVDQIDEVLHVPQTPQYWTDFPHRPCRWGVARKPSARLIEAFSGKLRG